MKTFWNISLSTFLLFALLPGCGYNLSTGHDLLKVEGRFDYTDVYESYIRGFAISEDGEEFYITHLSSLNIEVWDTKSTSFKRQFRTEGVVTNILVSPGNDFLACLSFAIKESGSEYRTSSTGREVLLYTKEWKTFAPAIKPQIKGTAFPLIANIVIDPDKEHVYLSYLRPRGRVEKWNIQSGKKIVELHNQESKSTFAIGIHKDKLVGVSREGIRVWSTKTGKELRSRKASWENENTITGSQIDIHSQKPLLLRPPLNSKSRMW
jgi:WD40 repeat protein